MKHADDDLLPHVAPLAHRDRAIFDPGLEWDRLFGHIDTEQRITGFNPRRLDSLGLRDDRASLDQRPPQIGLSCRLDVDGKAWDDKLADARDHDRRTAEVGPRVVILTPRREPSRAGQHLLEHR